MTSHILLLSNPVSVFRVPVSTPFSALVMISRMVPTAVALTVFLTTFSFEALAFTAGLVLGFLAGFSFSPPHDRPSARKTVVRQGSLCYWSEKGGEGGRPIQP